jgi:hypothetical protein
MKRICWQLAQLLSEALEPAEREAVLGDVFEQGKLFGSLRDVFGLVVRRQANLWMAWRPWAVAALLVVPSAFLLAFHSAHTSGSSAITFWPYLNNWDWNLLNLPAFRHDFPKFLLDVLLNGYIPLGCCSWVFRISGRSRFGTRSSVPSSVVLLLRGVRPGRRAATYFLRGQQQSSERTGLRATVLSRHSACHRLPVAGALAGAFGHAAWRAVAATLPNLPAWAVDRCAGFVRADGLASDLQLPRVAAFSRAGLSATGFRLAFPTALPGLLADFLLGRSHLSSSKKDAHRMKTTILLLVTITLAAAADAPTVSAQLQPPEERRPLPDFAVQDARGKKITMKKYRGHVVLLDFWATWCHGCKEEIP